jgi:anaerobic magnesium-protoporphyrin IX monomethyl ester cyclase
MALPKITKADVLLMTIPNNMEKIVGLGAKFVTPMAPHGLMYISAYLEKKKNVSCDILDCYALGYGVSEAVGAVIEANPKILGLSILTCHAYIAVEIIKELRQQMPELKIVLGNQHADIYADWFLSRNFADAVVHGDGEETFADLVEVYLSNHEPQNLMGISYTDTSGTVQKSCARQLPKNIDILPSPDWSKVPHHLYRLPFYGHPKAIDPAKFKNIFTSRGCPYTCNFCTVHHDRRINYHGTSRILDELDHLVNGMGAEYVFFMDSLFTLSHKKVSEICQGIIDRGIKFEWGCEGRADFAADYPEVLKLMRKAGCVQIPFGLESGNQAILNRVGKKLKLEKIIKGCKNTREANIEPVGLFILGLPGETIETMEETIKLAQNLDLAYAQFGIAVPYPGSELYYDLVKENKIDEYRWQGFSQYASFTEEDCIYIADGLTREILTKYQKKAIREFYLRWQPVWRSIRMFRPKMIPEILFAILMIFSGVFQFNFFGSDFFRKEKPEINPKNTLSLSNIDS